MRKMAARQQHTTGMKGKLILTSATRIESRGNTAETTKSLHIIENNFGVDLRPGRRLLLRVEDDAILYANLV